MEGLIEQYLYQHKVCPLPGIGALILKNGRTIIWHADNKISAPVPSIKLTDSEMPAEQFIAFIAKHNNIPLGEASLLLQKYCIDLKQDKIRETLLGSAGKFYVDASGALQFKQEVLPKEFLPTVNFQRVVHTKVANHQIRVGDTETTSDVMTEFYSEKETNKKDRWWIAALILLLLVATLVFSYFGEHSFKDKFGNTHGFGAEEAPATYQSVK